ncbi:MAG: aspartate carbamoyltransferase catalytic subunit, partial [Alphaproteobacteria bacterium]|nr:aspartate carbamoyltransferase catalytic subunit [Alphaproteobacteria bacterium]
MSAVRQSGQPPFTQPHLTGIDHLSRDEIVTILDLADDYAAMMNKGTLPGDLLKGRVILTLFFEHSTRTRTSFEIAAKRLGAEVVHWDAQNSSLHKGESFEDTIRTLGAMQPDAMVV